MAIIKENPAIPVERMAAMNSEGKIGIFEAVCFVTIITINKVFFTSVGNIVFLTGTAAWYATLISCLVTLIFFMFTYLLLKRFPDNDLTGIFESVTGKIPGKVLTLAISGYLLFNAGSTLREFMEMIKVYNLRFTPISVILTTFLIAAIVISSFGLQTLSRICAIFFIPCAAGLAIILLLAIPEYDIYLLNPIGGHGIPSTLYYGVTRSSAYFEFMLLSFAVQSIGGYKAYKRIAITSILLSGAIFSISLLCYLMVYGYASGSENISGIFELSRSIYYNRFVQRIESIFIFIWVISSVLSTTASFAVSLFLYCRSFTIKDHKPLVLPFAALVYIIAILPPSMQEVTQKSLLILRQYSMYIMYLPSVLVLFIALIFRKKGEKDNA